MNYMTKPRGLCVHGLMHPLHGQNPKGLNCVPYPAKRKAPCGSSIIEGGRGDRVRDMMFETEVEDRQRLALKMEDSHESRN